MAQPYDMKITLTFNWVCTEAESEEDAIEKTRDALGDMKSYIDSPLNQHWYGEHFRVDGAESGVRLEKVSIEILDGDSDFTHDYGHRSPSWIEINQPDLYRKLRKSGELTYEEGVGHHWRGSRK